MAFAGYLACGTATDTAAQTRSAVLEGTVRDCSGASISGAEVGVRDAATNQRRTLLTNDRGSFRFGDLGVGTYEIRVDHPGFATYLHAGVTLVIGQTVQLEIELAPAGIAETVSVSAQPSPLDVRQTAVATPVDIERIEELPVRSRNYLEFVLLAPGVAPSRSVSQPGGVAAMGDSGFSFGGLRPRSNTLSIDGLDNNDALTGGSRTELSLEIVREFQVVTSGWSAENGGASGGAINVITKTGANTLHGDVFLFGQSGALNARSPLDEVGAAKPSLARLRAGLAIGGPLVKDRTFYYTAAEREQMHGQDASKIDAQAISAINAALAAGRFPALGTRRLTDGLFATEMSETEWSAKITHQATERHALMVRFAGTNRREAPDASDLSGLTDLSARGTNDRRDVAVTGTWMSVLGSRMTNEVRGQVAARRVELRTTDQLGPAVLISGVASFGGLYPGGIRQNQTYAGIGDTLGFTLGSHFVKVGGDLMHVAVTGIDTWGARGLYAFRTVDTFLNGQPDFFQQVFGASTVDLRMLRTGVFGQDHWTPRPGLTIDMGLRLDAETYSPHVGVTNRQVSPRIGLAWTPVGKWVVRGGAGRFADRLVLAALERPSLWDGQRGFAQIVSGAGAATVFSRAAGGALSSPLDGLAPSISTVRPGRWQSSSLQASVGIEREITANLAASVTGIVVRGRDLPRTVNVNLRPSAVAMPSDPATVESGAPTGQMISRPVFGPNRINPAFSDVFELQPTASSSYRGVSVTLNRRFAGEVEWSAAYTWSHAKDTASDFDEQPQNPYAIGEEWGDSRYDERHRFVASALLDLPIGEEEDRKPGDAAPGALVRAFSHIEVAAMLAVGSGRAVTPVTGGDDLRTHAFPFTARLPGTARNSLRLPATAALDLRVLKYFNVKPHGKLDLVIEVFNVLNRVNITEVNPVYGYSAAPLASFRRPTSASPARQVQFSIDFEF